METKHTPGPWEQGTQTRGSTTLVARIETGFAVAEMRNVHFREEAEANARLIAAAPDGLAANIKARDAILDLLGSGMVSTDGSLIAALRDAMNECNVAIAKATGKTT